MAARAIRLVTNDLDVRPILIGDIDVLETIVGITTITTYQREVIEILDTEKEIRDYLGI